MDNLQRIEGLIKRPIEDNKTQAIIFEIKLEDLIFMTLEGD